MLTILYIYGDYSNRVLVTLLYTIFRNFLTQSVSLIKAHSCTKSMLCCIYHISIYLLVISNLMPTHQNISLLLAVLGVVILRNLSFLCVSKLVLTIKQIQQENSLPGNHYIHFIDVFLLDSILERMKTYKEGLLAWAKSMLHTMHSSRIVMFSILLCFCPTLHLGNVIILSSSQVILIISNTIFNSYYYDYLVHETLTTLHLAFVIILFYKFYFYHCLCFLCQWRRWRHAACLFCCVSGYYDFIDLILINDGKSCGVAALLSTSGCCGWWWSGVSVESGYNVYKYFSHRHFTQLSTYNYNFYYLYFPVHQKILFKTLFITFYITYLHYKYYYYISSFVQLQTIYIVKTRVFSDSLTILGYLTVCYNYFLINIRITLAIMRYPTAVGFCHDLFVINATHYLEHG